MSSSPSNPTTRKKKDKYRERRLALERLALENRLKALEPSDPTNRKKRSIVSISNSHSIGSISNSPSEPDSNRIIYMTNTLRDIPQLVSIEEYQDTIDHLNQLKTETTNKSAKRAIDEAILSITIHHKWNRQAGGKRTRSKRITRRRR